MGGASLETFSGEAQLKKSPCIKRETQKTQGLKTERLRKQPLKVIFKSSIRIMKGENTRHLLGLRLKLLWEENKIPYPERKRGRRKKGQGGERKLEASRLLTMREKGKGWVKLKKICTIMMRGRVEKL